MAKLFVVEGGKTEVLEAQPFDNETLLQDILEKFPEVIALDDLGVSEPFIVIGREVATPAGSIDVLCIDGEGVLTVIETKLARNPQIRREVVGQILECVGQVSKWRAQDVIQVASRYFQSESAPIEMRNRSLFDVLRGDAEPEGELLPDELYDRIDNNLRKGRVKIVIASDMIPETLKDTVTFVNSFSNFDIYVLQVQSFKKGNLQMYAPALFGFARKSGAGLATERGYWDEEKFFNVISNSNRETIETMRQLYEFSKKHAPKFRWGTGKVIGTFNFAARIDKRDLAIFTVTDFGALDIAFGNMKGVVSHEILDAFRKELNRLPGVDLPEEVTTTEGRWRRIWTNSLIDEECFDIFTSAVKALMSSLS